MIHKIASSRFVRLAMYAGLALLVLWAAVSILRPPQEVSAAPAVLMPSTANATEWICNTPANAAVFTNRVHLKCSDTPGSGVYYFAVSNADSATASRFLSIFNTAVVAGKRVVLWIDMTGNGSA